MLLLQHPDARIAITDFLKVQFQTPFVTLVFHGINGHIIEHDNSGSSFRAAARQVIQDAFNGDSPY